MAELVECPPAGGLFENGGSSFVGKSSTAGVWAFVSPRWDDVGSPMSEEHWSSSSPG